MFFFVRSKVKSFYLLPDEITTGSIHKYFVYIYTTFIFYIKRTEKKIIKQLMTRKRWVLVDSSHGLSFEKKKPTTTNFQQFLRGVSEKVYIIIYTIYEYYQGRKYNIVGGFIYFFICRMVWFYNSN